MASHDFTLKATLPPAPTTQRATPTRVDAWEDTIAYGSGSCVVVRGLGGASTGAKGGAVWMCTLHKAPVTAVRFSPNGAFVASGDQNGVLVVFANKAGTPEKYSSPILQGAVRDIAWTGDGERLVVVGEGRTTFGVAISITGNSLGAINGHTRAIASCDMRHDRPFRAFTGSADGFVGLYEGTPFVFKTNLAGHKGTVNCVRYSPAVNEVATCSSSADVILFDGTTGEEKRRVPTGHTGTVYALSWSPDGQSIATVSADRHVHVVNVAAGGSGGSVRHKIALGSGLSDMQQGVAWTASCGIVAVSLGGVLTTIDARDGKVTNVQAGHQGRVLFLHVCSGSGDLLSLSADGKLIRWSGPSGWTVNALVPLPAPADVANCATVCGDTLYMVAGNQVLVHDTRAGAPTGEVKVLSPSAGGFSPTIAVTASGKVALLSRAKLVILDEAGNTCAEETLPATLRATTAVTATCGEQEGSELVIVGGDRMVKVFRVDAGGRVTDSGVGLGDRHTGTVSCVAVSRNGDRVASADGTSRSIVVWSPVTGEVLIQHPMCHHTAAVTAMAFHPAAAASWLLSGGLDCTLIAWDLAAAGAGGRRRMEDAAHRGGVTAVAWGQEAGTDLFSAGGDHCIKCWSL